MRIRLPFYTLALIIFTVGVLFARRPDQFLHPYIWVEDGVYILRFVLQDGWLTIFEPLAGYLLFATKLMSYLAFKMSVLWAPEIELILIVAFTCGVAAAVALSPTHLRWPYLCAVTMLLVPSDSEVFAVSSYAFWWAGILLILALLWDRGLQPVRWLFVVVGGLSSPLAVSLLPLFVVRAVWERQRVEFLTAGLATLTAIAQVWAMRFYYRVSIPIETLNPATVRTAVDKFIGNFFYAGPEAAFIGPIAIIVMALMAWYARRHLDRHFVLLIAIFGIVCASVSLRLTPGHFTSIDPFHVAPRYFFYPFILVSWILVWLARESAALIRVGVLAAMAGALMVALPHSQGRHDAIDWRQHIANCARSVEYEVPVHYLGNAKQMWSAKFTGEECRRLLAGSLF
jgi:hypothetical protein